MDAPLIICASTQYWDEAWFRKQHFMSRLSARYPILYVEPSFFDFAPSARAMSRRPCESSLAPAPA
ncbi:MAG: hypothetical protein V1774_08805 [Candidatus Eisenbacteria bacterium]